MADVNISKYRASVVREGSKPATPGFVVSEGQDPVNPPGTNNFVPYSGATSNVELGEFGLETGFINLDTTPTGTPTTQGTIFWDADDETVDIILNGYTMKIGEDLFYPVKNQTGSTIAKGVAVRFAGTLGASGRLLIEPFIANGTVPSSRFMGVTAEEILNGDDGKVLYFGRIRGINTDAFNEGDILYASTTVAGGYQTAIPLPPNNIVEVAAVISKSATVGTIFVRPTLGSNINTDEGVKITSVADKNLLQYQSGTSLWENKTLAQVLGGTSSQFVKGDGSLDSTSYGTGTVTSVGLSSATSGVTIGSSPVTTSGTITLAIATASGSQNGLLSSTDWTTFNNKQNALTNPVTGTGTTNYLPKFTGSTTIGNSQIQDSGSLVTINSETKFQVGANATRNVYFGTSTTNYGRITYNDATGELAIGTIENYSTLFVSNNTTKMTLFSSGNLLVGTGSDNGARLQVSGTATVSGDMGLGIATPLSGGGAAKWLTLEGTTTYSGGIVYSVAGAVKFYHYLDIDGVFAHQGQSGVGQKFITNGSERMRITSSGNVGIGTGSPSQKLHVEGTGTTYALIKGAGNNTTGLLTQNGNKLYFTGTYYNISNAWEVADLTAGGLTRLAITSSGNVLIGTTTDAVGVRLRVEGGAIRSLSTYDNTSATAANLVVSSGGTFERSTSSLKYKKEVRDYDKGLEVLKNMRPVYYKGKSQSDGNKQFAGLIAEEVHDLGLNEFVQYANDGTPDALAYTHMIALLINSIKELKQEIDTLKN